jgi:hypothetical protein
MTDAPRRPSHPVGAAGDGAFDDELEAERVVRSAARIRRGLGVLRTVTITAFVLFFLAVIASPIGPIPLQCRSKQSEAKTELKALYVEMMAGHAEHDRFSRAWVDLAARNGRDRRRPPRYWITLDVVDDDHFVASAVGKPGSNMTGDLWRIDERNELRSLINRCAQ